MFRWLSIVLVLIFLPMMIFIYVFGDQGIDLSEELPFEGVSMQVDQFGIPTLTANRWDALVEAQGFVVAGERMFQMDLARRSAEGTLAEWFGEPALKLDQRVLEQDWLARAEEGANQLQDKDQEWCEAYSRGVNKFIASYRGRWGVEYSLLRVEPKAWSCKDSLLVLLSMADRMSGLSRSELRLWQWRRYLPSSWQSFLFPDDHPWNVPLFGKPTVDPVQFPSENEYLPLSKVDDLNVERLFSEPHVAGSNSWAYRSDKGYFLANDPHLNYQVPQIWYPLRMRISASEWVAGVSLPGMPGVILGMNEHLAWSFTNTGEDVDDVLIEEISEDESEYVAGKDGRGEKIWARVQQKVRTVRIKDLGKRDITIRWTHRGPLFRERVGDQDVWVTRQWLGLQKRILGLPIGRMNRARNWDEINDAIDGLTVPAQNVVVMDRQGNMGYRVSGTGIERRSSGRIPQMASNGEWLGLSPSSERRRLFISNAKSEAKPRYLVTANQKIWHAPFGANWFAEDRADRIRYVLEQSDQLGMEDMKRLQIDTHARFMKVLAQWIARNGSPQTDLQKNIVKRLRDWNGVAASDKKAFTDLLIAYHAFGDVLLAKIKKQWLENVQDLPKFKYYQQRAWMLHLLQSESGFRIFGLQEADVANFLLNRMVEDRKRQDRQLYHVQNRNQAQHPFVGRVPFLGELFRIREIPQTGYDHLVKAEGTHFGASVRVVYDLKNPISSNWVFPVGQSGHLFSSNFRSFQALWARNERVPVLDPALDWK